MKPDDGITCDEARRLLYDIIDREASEVDARAVQDHLVRCRECFSIYRLEESIQDFICERLRNSGPPCKAEQLKNRIMTELDRIDNEAAA
jgi:anti-sigma factor (TIGR02949 family)